MMRAEPIKANVPDTAHNICLAEADDYSAVSREPEFLKKFWCAVVVAPLVLLIAVSVLPSLTNSNRELVGGHLFGLGSASSGL
jgi:hypothetical protein